MLVLVSSIWSVGSAFTMRMLYGIVLTCNCKSYFFQDESGFELCVIEKCLLVLPSVKLAVWKNKPIWNKNSCGTKQRYDMSFQGDVIVFLCSLVLCITYHHFSLVSSRYWWYCRLDHACVTWINASRDISSLLVKILARDHGSLGLSVWSIDAIISSIFSSFSVSFCVGAPYFCGGSVILLPTGWFIRLCHMICTIYHRQVVVPPHTSLPGPDWRCLW